MPSEALSPAPSMLLAQWCVRACEARGGLVGPSLVSSIHLGPVAAISNIHKRTTGDPIDAAIAVSYVGDRFGNES